MISSMQIQPLSVMQILDYAALNHADTEIISRTADGSCVTHTYQSLHLRTRKLAGALRDEGYRLGDAIATIAWNHHRHLELYYAIPGMGGVLHTINPRMPLEQIRYMIEQADDKAVFFDSDFSGLIDALKPLVDPDIRFYELSDSGSENYRDYEQLLSSGDESTTWTEVDENHPFAVCFTSGTTGNPKGVVYSHRSTVLHAMGCCMSEGQAISSRETVLPVVPMFHANAWGIPHSAPMAGARLVLPRDRMDGSSLIELINRERVTFFCGVPTVWQGILDTAEKVPRAFEALSRAGIGGAAPSGEMIVALESLGLSVFHAWGMTETNPFGGTGFLKSADEALPNAQRLEKKRCQGREVFGLQRRIVSESGEEQPRDGVAQGHLQVRGNWVVDRYLNQSESALTDGWFDTGDIATIDRDGYMTIVDRAKDLIKSGGEWISSIEMENLACQVEGVNAAACVAKADEKWGERPVLYITCTEDISVSQEAVIDALSGAFAKWQLPDEVFVSQTLPLTATGKIDKKALRAQLNE